MKEYRKVHIEFHANGGIYQQEMAKFPVHSTKQPQSTKQEFATPIRSSKRATSTAQLVLFVKPISKLLPGWRRKEPQRKGDSCWHSSFPVTSHATVHYHLLPRPSRKAVDEAHTPTQWKHLQKEHGEGCINRCSSIDTNFILGMKLKRTRCQQCSWFLREGITHSQAMLLTPRPMYWSCTADMSHCFNIRWELH